MEFTDHYFLWQVTAAKRPKNSALEVDLDFEHNVRPAPVITEEVTASLEELIQKRILEVKSFFILLIKLPFQLKDTMLSEIVHVDILK